MIAKGTTHRDGAILARYFVTGKERERAELWQLRGFACTGIVPAFRSVHVMAAATKCAAPFFHVSVRMREEETLDRSQWEYAANCIERMLGFTDQPRAIAFHTAEDTGHSHMHIAWSRIDQETFTAKPLPFWKQRLKNVSRDLEKHFGLTPVRNERESAIRFAPTRSEAEQARRLGVDIHATRELIRRCFETADCGRSFQSALADCGIVLARGDRRDFLVVDRAGGIHALGKRVLGVSAADIRQRLADLPADSLPTLEQARHLVATQNDVRHSPEAWNARESRIAYQNRDTEPGPSRLRVRVERTVGEKSRHDHSAASQSPIPPVWKAFDHEAPEPFSNLSNADVTTASSEVIADCCLTPTDRMKVEDQVFETTPTPHSLANEPLDPKQAGNDPVQVSHRVTECLPAQKNRGFAERLKHQFRALVWVLTSRSSSPQPQARRRRTEETAGAFRRAARAIMRPILRLPIAVQVTAYLQETLPWLHFGDWNENTDHFDTFDGPGTGGDNHPSPEP